MLTPQRVLTDRTYCIDPSQNASTPGAPAYKSDEKRCRCCGTAFGFLRRKHLCKYVHAVRLL